MEEYPFPYNMSWVTHTLSDNKGQAYLFYLSEGSHEISMTVKVGFSRNIINELNTCSTILSKLIRRIILITGNNPDLNYEYELDKTVPNLKEDFNEIIAGVQKCIDILKTMTDRSTSIENNLKQRMLRYICKIVRSFADPLII